jgi:hypothetical protein
MQHTYFRDTQLLNLNKAVELIILNIPTAERGASSGVLLKRIIAEEGRELLDEIHSN